MSNVQTMLHENVHSRLIADLPKICRVANIPTHMLHESMKEYCSKTLVQWVANLPENREKGEVGLILGHCEKHSAETRMEAIAAACIRNFIDARVMTMGTAMALLQEMAMPDVSVILIPNFYSGIENVVMAWRREIILDWLVRRQMKNLVTLLYVTDIKKMKLNYGESIFRHIEQNYSAMR